MSDDSFWELYTPKEKLETIHDYLQEQKGKRATSTMVAKRFGVCNLTARTYLRMLQAQERIEVIMIGKKYVYMIKEVKNG